MFKKLSFFLIALSFFFSSGAFARTEKPGHDLNSFNNNSILSSSENDDENDDDEIAVIEYDFSKLPPPVAQMREKLIAAAKTGDIEKLRPLLDVGEDGTQISLIEVPKDPIALLKSVSGDDDGVEVLAILLDILNAGYVHLDSGKDSEIYVWPYFFAVPLNKLSNSQKVELLQIITAGDYEQMKELETYVFYRAGISPDGKWRFFITGD